MASARHAKIRIRGVVKSLSSIAVRNIVRIIAAPELLVPSDAHSRVTGAYIGSLDAPKPISRLEDQKHT
jgi:hypothetical protein